MMEWTLFNFLICTLFVASGSLMQAVTGLGGGLIIVPLLATISYDLIPGPIMFASMSLSSQMAFKGRHEIDFSNMRFILIGLVAGTIITAIFIAKLPVSQLGIIFGIMILLSVIISLKTSAIKLSKKSLLGTGILSGVMGTASGIGAPVLALVYQHHSGQSSRPTLAFLYLVSSIIMLLVLAFVGKFNGSELTSGFYLIPGFILGYFLSPKLVGYIDKGYARPVILLLSTVSAVVLIVRSL
jgi:hypothetical protein